MERLTDNNEEKKEIPTYGGVEVPEAAQKLLINQPKLVLWPKIDITQVMTEIEKGYVKRRWDEMSRQQREDQELDEENLEDELAQTRVYDSSTCTVDLRKMRVTKPPSNRVTN